MILITDENGGTSIVFMYVQYHIPQSQIDIIIMYIDKVSDTKLVFKEPSNSSCFVISHLTV